MTDVVRLPLTKGRSVLIDAADLPAVSCHRWHASDTGEGRWYAARRRKVGEGRPGTIKMHTFLTGWPQVDHINGDGLDNRRCNLRPATSAQNSANARRARTSRSPYKGVEYQRSGRWRARICPRGQSIELGFYDTAEKAARAYDSAARAIYGEFAYLNLPEES